MVRPDLKDFLKTIPEGIRVVAATKYVEPEDMIKLLQNGIDNFGENRVESFLYKKASLLGYENIKWHFIGHLQRNKAKKVINEIDCLHSLDSLELAEIGRASCRERV